MNSQEFFQHHADDILSSAETSLQRAHLQHYEKAGTEQVHKRLKALYVLTARAVKEKNLGPMTAHAETIARERFDAGFDLTEVQTAFNVLEEAIWTNILRHLDPKDYAEALGLVSTVLGVGKDTLAREYVTLASKVKAPSLNLQSLFSGTAGT